MNLMYFLDGTNDVFFCFVITYLEPSPRLQTLLAISCGGVVDTFKYSERSWRWLTTALLWSLNAKSCEWEDSRCCW